MGHTVRVADTPPHSTQKQQLSDHPPPSPYGRIHPSTACSTSFATPPSILPRTHLLCCGVLTSARSEDAAAISLPLPSLGPDLYRVLISAHPKHVCALLPPHTPALWGPRPRLPRTCVRPAPSGHPYMAPLRLISLLRPDEVGSASRGVEGVKQLGVEGAK